MLTIFSVPKAFESEFKTIQVNAINSWRLFKPQPEIILLGQERGVADFCEKNSLILLPEIKTNKYNTPILNDIFEKAVKVSKNKILMYVNSDIIFTENVMRIVSKLSRRFDSFLACGLRYELKTHKIIDFLDTNWYKKISQQTLSHSYLKGPGWIDYFIFTKSLLKKINNIPPFAIGRPFWNKWLFWKVVSLNKPLIDTTGDIFAIHQTHSYNYRNYNSHSVWKGEEAKENMELAGGWSHGYSLKEATHIYKNGQIIVKKHNPVRQKLVRLLKLGLDKFPFQSLLLKLRYSMNWG